VLRLNAKQRSAITVPLSAAVTALPIVAVRISGPNGYSLTAVIHWGEPASQCWHAALFVRLQRRKRDAVRDLFAHLVPGSASVAFRSDYRVRSTRPGCCRLSIVILRLFRTDYEAGPCRSSTSTILASEAQPLSRRGIDQRIRDAIDRLVRAGVQRFIRPLVGWR